ncbi:hypothetical protein T10_2739 [Trichinella papuae]|uniref:Uncharacterized protein n=1 Tax=Trichinella papuae TaxID=268474 RepID=A0A0V1ME48_9BILA|nr:hypothetical protein T10_2739 [Trichinella papuae]
MILCTLCIHHPKLMTNTPEARCLNQETKFGCNPTQFQNWPELGRTIPGAETTGRSHISRTAVQRAEKGVVHFHHLKMKNTHQLMTELNRDWAGNTDAADQQSDVP